MARLEHILKTNSFLQKIYVIVFTIFFRFIGLFVRTDEHLILLIHSLGSFLMIALEFYLKRSAGTKNIRIISVFGHLMIQKV